MMNYFAHGRHYVDDPCFLAGTATPDWLCVVNRACKARARLAQPFAADEDPLLRAVARGILQHHHDDGWFHQTRAFAELNLEFSVGLREYLPDKGFRRGFLAHVLVELLLDAALIEDDPARLDAYYEALDGLDVEAVSNAINRMTTQPTGLLALFIPRFSAERFLYDYAEDGKLLFRLNRVMHRVGLQQLPAHVVEFFPHARTRVRERMDELLVGERLTNDQIPMTNDQTGDKR